MSRLKSLGCALFAFGALLAAPAAALAHAHLDHAAPAAESKLNSPPKSVTLWFTEAIEPKFSGIVVRDAKGTTVTDGAAEAVSGNTAELRVMLKPLGPGTYTVEWRVLSVDTHRTRGTFSFTVAP